MATEAERERYAAGKALAEAMIRWLGGDPQRPTVEQAETVARFLLEPARAAMADRSTADIDALVQSGLDLRTELKRETH